MSLKHDPQPLSKGISSISKLQPLEPPLTRMIEIQVFLVSCPFLPVMFSARWNGRIGVLCVIPM